MDEQGTRCEQRIREGYFPLGEGLIRPSEAEPLSWSAARALCQQEGAELLTVDDSQVLWGGYEGGTWGGKGLVWQGKTLIGVYLVVL